MAWESSLSWSNAKIRSEIINNIRHFFANKNVIEVETPLLSNGTITDVYIEAFSTRYNFLSESSIDEGADLYLQTSPEFAMKRLLASGYGCIFQLCKAFRHEGYGKHHNPEFTMLEWYRVGFNHIQLMDEVGELLRIILNCNKPTKISYQNVFLNHLGIDPLDTTLDALKMFIIDNKLSSDWLLNSLEIDTLLQFLFSEIIEPKIGLTSPCFVYDFPSSQASLARISPMDSRVAERFECYYRGIELANGFHELTDHNENYDRFMRDNQNRRLNELPNKPIDQNFISALKKGLPDCAGVALGVDRLIMLATNKDSIKQVLTFNIEDA